MGEGVIEATITKILKQEGDQVREDDTILEVATDKVDSEIPSPATGIVAKIFFSAGDVPKIGDVLALIVTEGENVTEEDEAHAHLDTHLHTVAIPGHVAREVSMPEIQIPEDSLTTAGKFLSPLVKSIISSEHISPGEVATIQGTGKDGRLTKADVLSWLENRGNRPAPVPASPSSPAPAQTPAPPAQPAPKSQPAPAGIPQATAFGKVEIIEMDRVRKLIAGYMVKSKQVSPHVTSFVEIDVTTMVAWRNRTKDVVQKRDGEKLTFTPLFIEATARALRDFPMINVSVDGDQIIIKKYINIGMATALPNGNLIVPVIKNVDEKSLLGISKSVNDLANRARANKLQPDEIVGGTFTITNFCTFNNITGTPIINQPEVAILGVGSIQKKPAVIETPQGDLIGIRHIMILSLSYDHRVVDGALGGMFLRRVGDYLENWDPARTI